MISHAERRLSDPAGLRPSRLPARRDLVPRSRSRQEHRHPGHRGPDLGPFEVCLCRLRMVTASPVLERSRDNRAMLLWAVKA
jgi:hypothetical protein